MRRLLGLVLLLAAAVWGYFAGMSVLWQDAAVRRFVPTPAEIDSAQVKVHRSSKSTTYSPEAHYRYTFQNRQYESDRVLPFDESSSGSWADDVARPYIEAARKPPGQRTVTAYVNPDRPEEAILARQYSFTPYFLTMLPIGLGLFGLGLLSGLAPASRKTMTAVPIDDVGTQLLLPTQALRTQVRTGFAGLAAAFLAVVPLGLHWVLVARTFGLFAVVVLAAGMLLLAAAAVNAFRRWSVSGHLSDARLRVRPAPMRRGDVFVLELDADAYAPLRVKEARARVVCIEHYRQRSGNKTTYQTRIRGEQTAVFRQNVEIPAGQLLEGKGELFFPAGSLPPTDANTSVYPHHTWEIRLEVELEGAVDYHATFPLTVT